MSTNLFLPYFIGLCKREKEVLPFQTKYIFIKERKKLLNQPAACPDTHPKECDNRK